MAKKKAITKKQEEAVEKIIALSQSWRGGEAMPREEIIYILKRLLRASLEQNTSIAMVEALYYAIKHIEQEV